MVSAKERALATAFFDSGSSIGGALSPFLVLWIYFHWGWRPAFVVPGILGFIWLLVWRKFYYPPEQHPHISAGELEMFRQEKRSDESSSATSEDTLARSTPIAADLGCYRSPGIHGSSLVLRHRLVSGLPGCKGN